MLKEYRPKICNSSEGGKYVLVVKCEDVFLNTILKGMGQDKPMIKQVGKTGWADLENALESTGADNRSVAYYIAEKVGKEFKLLYRWTPCCGKEPCDCKWVLVADAPADKAAEPQDSPHFREFF